MVVKLEVHPVVYLVVLECDVILEDGVPLLQDDLFPTGASLGCDQFLKSQLMQLCMVTELREITVPVVKVTKLFI